MSRTDVLDGVGERIVAAAKLAVAMHLMDSDTLSPAAEQTLRNWFDDGKPRCTCGGCGNENGPATDGPAQR